MLRSQGNIVQSSGSSLPHGRCSQCLSKEIFNIETIIIIFMFIVVTGLISIDRSLRLKLKNDEIIIDKLNEIAEGSKDSNK